MTTSDKSQGALPAEWEPVEAVLLAWPHENTDWEPILWQARCCYVEMIKAISARAKVVIIGPKLKSARDMIGDQSVIDKCIFVEMPTNDTWTRDYGPICTVDKAASKVYAHDFTFNGWGLKFAANHDNMATRHLLSSGMVSPEAIYVNELGFVAEGGAIDTNGNGDLLLTTSSCVFSNNRNEECSHAQIIERLLSATGTQRAFVIEHGDIIGDDTDGHVDTLARFLSPEILAYASCDREDDANFAPLIDMERQIIDNKSELVGDGKLIPLPIPNPIYDENGDRLPATYANFLILNGAVLLPVYGDEKYDRIAIDRISAAMPGYEVVPIDCRPLIRQHGSLHCATMQLPAGFLQ